MVNDAERAGSIVLRYANWIVALHVGVEEDIIVNIVMEKEDAVITPQLAEALHKALNIPAHFWINRQRHYDESLGNQQVVKV